MIKKRTLSEPTKISPADSSLSRQPEQCSSGPVQVGQDLRQRAETIFSHKAGQSPQDLAALSPEETGRILHDLQVHQIELEIQNEELRRVQVELDASRERYFDLYDLAPVGYCTLNQKGQILEANLTVTTLFSLNRELLTRQPLSRFILPEDQWIYALHLKKLFETGRLQSCELRMVKIDKTVFWVNLDANITQESDGGPICRVMLSDISRLKQAEEALLESSEERFRMLLQEVQSVAVQGYGPDNITHYWNHASELLYGYRAHEAIGRNLLELIIPPEIRGEVGRAIRQMAETGQPIPAAEISLMRKDGSLVTVFSSHTIVQLPGRAKELYCIDIDLTERKQIEDALRESEERYRQLFESASDALFLIAPDSCQIIKTNNIAAELYGYDQEELLTKKCMELSAEPEETCRRTQDMQSCSEQILRAPLRLHRKKDGTVFPVEITARSFPFNGKPFLLAAIRDISERMLAEKEKAKLEAMNWQLQKRESLKRMAGAIAHHFNNRLGVVIGNLEMVIDDLPRGAMPRYNLSTALESAQKAAEISGLLLTYLGQTTGHFTPLDLSETCRNNLPLLQAAIPKTITMSLNLPTPGPVVCGNAHQLQQVMNNLVTNAWEAACEKKGSIDLTVKTVTQAEIPTEHCYPIGWLPTDSAYACIEVKDSGCGIAREDIDNLFDPFFSNKFTGRGLGLPVVLGIVKAHDGAVSVESETEKGSIFRVFLPVFDTATKPGQLPVVPKIISEVKGGTVLLVDDEDAVREMTEAMLTRLGFTVISAKNGLEAIDVYQQRKNEIDCVLCDMTMPEIDGYETFSALQRISPDVKFIISSGYSEEQVLDRFAGRGIVGFLHKPYFQAELATIVRQALQ